MTLIDRISQDIASAMKAKESTRLGALRMAKAALMNSEVQKARALDDAESLQVMTSLIKQRRDSIDQFRKGGREDLAAKEHAEIGTLEAYVPPPLDPAEIERAVDEAIRATGGSSAKDIGQVMKAAMAALAGRGADGRTVNEIVRRRLGGA
jgi:uncharacterized protein